MCGVFGFVTKHERARQASLLDLDAGLKAIQHRGPDGSGQWISRNGIVGLGHVRLAIIDLETGSQPIVSPDENYAITFNGEIYNYPEIKSQLTEFNFKTSSDTEVILNAYRKWGAACLGKLRGMFSFAIWDHQRQELFVARDRFGIKPLYWTRNKTGVYFASEMKALLPFLEPREINERALSDYFSFQFCLGEKTLLKNVWQVPAAHYFLLRPGETPQPQRYWEVNYELDYSHTEHWFKERLTDLVSESVNLHLRADVEVGSYVSGGVDSSLLAALARKNRPEQRFQIFNGRFTDHPNFDESSYARALATEQDMLLHVADISEMDFVENISKVIWHLDQPTAGPGSFPQYMVSKLVKPHLKVVLGGQGGDEIFGGYARYLVAYFEQCIKGAVEGTLKNGNFVVTYESIIPNLVTLKQYKPMLQEFWAEGVFGELDRRYWRLVNRANTFGGILAPGSIQHDQTFEEFKSVFWGKNVGKESYFDLMTHFDFKTLLPALLQVEDRMSMAHGVESRVPFLDHPLVEFAATIPADIKFRNGELKRLLKAVFSNYLPQAITQRKDKMGFPVPLNLWLKKGGPAREFIGDLLGSQKAMSRSYLTSQFNVDAVLDSQSVYGRNLWALLSLELWQKQFMDLSLSG